MKSKAQDGGGRMGGAFEWTRAAMMEGGEVSTLLEWYHVPRVSSLPPRPHLYGVFFHSQHAET